MYVWLTPSRRPRVRTDHLPGPLYLNHCQTSRLITRDSCALRHGRGGRHFARAFTRFRSDASREGMNPQFGDSFGFSMFVRGTVLEELPATCPRDLKDLAAKQPETGKLFFDF